MIIQQNGRQIEQWGLFQIVLEGPTEGNPFTDVTLAGRFSCGQHQVEVNGFYDGEGRYVLRLMPDIQGEWRFETISSVAGLSGHSGSFTCTSPGPGNHGPVRVNKLYHFAYADGKSYYPFGTTSYGWAHQKAEIAAQTLTSLGDSSFNKIRMCVLPHYSEYSAANICCYPFAGDPENGWDYKRFDVRYFQMIEQRIEALLNLGIEADIILLHPYNKEWGFESMPAEADDRYMTYVVRRLSAYRNVWWSLANEYDLLPAKSKEDWIRFGQIIQANDTARHLISNHNFVEYFDNWLPWISHACIQDGLAVAEKGRSVALRNAYNKPVIYDEVCYEGNFSFRWGNLTPEEMTLRFWQGVMGGTYVGHGEVMRGAGDTADSVWTGIGGRLRGESPARIGFLRQLVEDNPAGGLEPIDKCWYSNIAGVSGQYYLIYFGRDCPESWDFAFPIRGAALDEGTRFKVEVIDTCQMEIMEIDTVFEVCRNQYEYGDLYKRRVQLPGKPYMAIRITRCE